MILIMQNNQKNRGVFGRKRELTFRVDFSRIHSALRNAILNKKGRGKYGESVKSTDGRIKL